LDAKTIKEYVNSWRVWGNESIISNWLPMYSDNNTKAYEPKKLNNLDLNDTSRLTHSEEMCQMVYDLVLEDQMKLLENYCWNEKLRKLKLLSRFLLNGCTYDYWLTQENNILLNFYRQLNLLKLKEPIACLSPLLVIGQMEINTTNNTLDLKVFESNISDTVLRSFPTIDFDMDGQTNSSISNLELNLFHTNGSMQLNFKKTGNYLIKIGGTFKPFNGKLNVFDDYGGVVNQPGITHTEVLVRFTGKDINGGSSFNTRLLVGKCLQILIGSLFILIGI